MLCTPYTRLDVYNGFYMPVMLLYFGKYIIIEGCQRTKVHKKIIHFGISLLVLVKSWVFQWGHRSMVNY